MSALSLSSSDRAARSAVSLRMLDGLRRRGSMTDSRHPMVYRSARLGRAAVLMLTSQEDWERMAGGPDPVFRPVVRAF
jgi:hypothetical protein